MILLAAGCSFRNTAVGLRERLAFDEAQVPNALDQLGTRLDCEAVILSTCNRVELYLARDTDTGILDGALVAELLAELRGLPASEIAPQLDCFHQAEAVKHLFRVVASLDSLIVGESQIAGQVKRAYELARARAATGPVLNALFQRASEVGKRVRTETEIARGQASVASAAVGYLRDVFEHFGDKTILVIGAGKMGELTLKHLKQLKPRRIWVTNRSSEKAEVVAQACGGTAFAWDQLDAALVKADIILSTTGAPEHVVSLDRFNKIRARRSGGPVVIFDIAVPRDFDPRIHDGDQACLYNIDDLMRVRGQTLQDRLKHVPAAEAIVEKEHVRFLKEWGRRRSAPIIARLTQEAEAKRKAMMEQLFRKLDAKLSDAEKASIEGAVRLFQNQLLHSVIAALADDAHPVVETHSPHTLMDAARKLLRLQE
jgi:glutamyl-tRNA reductase